MTASATAPRNLRLLATLATCAATVVALANLPDEQLPTPWLLAFTLPGAVLGGWARLTRSPWRRALLAVTLQASACWAALELVGPMSRPAALACTILPPLAFATARNHDTDPSLALFLGFCVLLVGVILDGLHVPLLLGYVVAAFGSLHAATLLQTYRDSAPTRRAPRLRALDLNASSLLLMSCLLATFAIERTLTCLPSPSRDADDAASAPAAADGRREVGLDDTFSFDGAGGLLSELRGEQLLRVESAAGPLSPAMYLRCGFFTVPGLDRWGIGPLDLRGQSEPDGHVFRRARGDEPLRTVEIERYAGAARFVFLPPHTTEVRGLEGLEIDERREWVRPQDPDATPYEVTWQQLGRLPEDARADRSARGRGLLTLPARLDLRPYRSLLEQWRVSDRPAAAMRAIAAGLAERCRYDRSGPSGPYGHELENFLFEDGDHRGYCMHFASAAALLLRMRGIPCRIGVGLYGGAASRDGADVRTFGSQHAHAWVEVPVRGRGFVVFDPTPSEARGRGFVPDERSQPDDDAEASLEGAFYDPAVRAVTEVVTTPWTWALALAATLVFAALPRRAPRPRASPQSPTATKARRALQQLMRALAKAGHRRAPGQTLEGFAADLERQDRLDPAVAAAFAAYQEVRFGGRSYDSQREQAMVAGARAAAALPPPGDAAQASLTARPAS